MDCKNCLADATPARHEGYPRNSFCSASCEAAYRIRLAENERSADQKFPWAAVVLAVIVSLAVGVFR